MANRFFSYGFQVKRTKKTGIIFLLVIVILIGSSIYIYKSKTSTDNVKKLVFDKSLGMNSFEDTSCDKAYRINYKKMTCGTICFKVLDEDSNYINKISKKMEENGFTITNIESKKINKQTWRYFKTESTPEISYYTKGHKNNTYVVEVIDQSSYLTKDIKTKCEGSFKDVINSVKLK